MWESNALETLRQDVRYAARGLRNSPGFTAVVILSLALGIGANTAVFGLMNTLLLRALPVRSPSQLVEFLWQYPGDPPLNGFSRQSYEYFRDHSQVFSAVSGLQPARLHVRGDGLAPEIVVGEAVIGNLFPLLGLHASLGRLIGPSDDHAGDPNAAVAVLSWQYWLSRFHGDASTLGKSIVVEGIPMKIVGVAPREFSGLQAGLQPAIWIPSAAALHPSGYGRAGAFQLIARLKPGVSLEQARAEMAVLFRWVREERSRNSTDSQIRRIQFEVRSASAGLSTELGDRFARPLAALLVLAGLLLLVACTNVASLLLARGAARRRDLGLRLSLGASRLRLVCQVMTESWMLSFAGASIGVLLASFGANALARIITSVRTPGVPLEIQVHPDLYVLLFTLVITLLTGLLFGIVPAWGAFHVAPAISLRETGDTRSRRLWGKSLVVAQVAFSTVLLSAAALFTGYLSHLEHVDLGFRRDHLLLLSLDPSKSDYDGRRLLNLDRELLSRLEALPGVRSASFGDAPLSGAGASSFAQAEGFTERPDDHRYVSLRWIGPRYFETLGTPLLAGRDFRREDENGRRVVIINRAMANYFFRGRNPIGKHIALERDWKGFGLDQPYEIIGVAGDANYYEIRETPPRTVYFDAFREGAARPQFLLHTTVAPLSIAPAVRRAARDLLPAAPIARVTTLADQVDATIVPERLTGALSAISGAIGALLAAIGIYGLLSYTFARRVNEIGIRMALGAKQGDIARIVLREALLLTGGGLLLGLPVALRAKSLAVRLIPDLPWNGAVPLTFAALSLISLALAAACIPAIRAARVDPAVALRRE